MTPEEFQQLLGTLKAHGDRLDAVAQRQMTVESVLEVKLGSTERQMMELQNAVQALMMDRKGATHASTHSRFQDSSTTNPPPAPELRNHQQTQEDILRKAQDLIDSKMAELEKLLESRDRSSGDAFQPSKGLKPTSIDTRLQDSKTIQPIQKDAKVKDVEHFDGNSAQFETFWTALTTYFQVQPLSYPDTPEGDFRKVAYTLSILRGTPKDWLAALVARSSQGEVEAYGIVHDFSQFAHLFRELYRDPNSAMTADAELESLREDACHDTREYFTRFEELYHRSANCSGTSRDKLGRLKRGLSVKSIRILLDNALIIPELDFDYAKVKWFLLAKLSNNAACTTLASSRKPGSRHNVVLPPSGVQQGSLSQPASASTRRTSFSQPRWSRPAQNSNGYLSPVVARYLGASSDPTL